MARSDDANDFLHTFTSEGEGKSKSTRIAPLEVGRDEAPARLLALDELSSGSIRTPPSGTRLLHFDSAGELVSETGSGTTEEVRGADDLVALTGSPVPVGSGTSLELEQGQSIRDETGSDRITVDSSGVTISTLDVATVSSTPRFDQGLQVDTGESIQDDTGTDRITLGGSDVVISTLDVNTFSTTPRFDRGLQVDQGEAIEDDSGTSRVSINSGDVGIETADVGSFSTQPTFTSGLQVSRGQSILDDTGDERISINGIDTIIRDEDGKEAFTAQNDVQITVNAFPGQPFLLNDEEGGFTAVEYATSGTPPGTLSLDNAVLEANASGSAPGLADVALTIGAADPAESRNLALTNGNGNTVRLRNESGELVAEDANGNQTTLT